MKFDWNWTCFLWMAASVKQSTYVSTNGQLYILMHTQQTTLHTHAHPTHPIVLSLSNADLQIFLGKPNRTYKSLLYNKVQYEALLYEPWNSEAIFSADLKPARVDMNSNIFFFEYIRSSKRIARLSGWLLLLNALPCAWILQRAQAHDIRNSSHSITNLDIEKYLYCYFIYLFTYLLFMVLQQYCTYLLSSRSRSGSWLSKPRASETNAGFCTSQVTASCRDLMPSISQRGLHSHWRSNLQHHRTKKLNNYTKNIT